MYIHKNKNVLPLVPEITCYKKRATTTTTINSRGKKVMMVMFHSLKTESESLKLERLRVFSTF
ncbi:hypothetical protein DERF_006394 [Dermatophagoides farinae]|uniref:Uncharacterized protein n=1 Tax=Dermatophagoides farinae TaxID=6954 RepID=A0A922L736_DERFA|nr:hypothetical protein DERF_006394 [Dermatophagoides farinae]